LDWKELIGFVAGALTTLGFIPQVWRLFRLRSAHEISFSFAILFIVGIGFWLSYGILMGLPPVIIWNAIAFALGWAMLFAKLRYGK
jgi:MtN3 and saliva related transmembrane protein